MFLQILFRFLAMVGLGLFTWTQTFFGGTVTHTNLSPIPTTQTEVTSTTTVSIATSSPSLPKKTIQPAHTQTATTIPKITTAPPPTPAPVTTAQNLAANEEARDAIVNILCTTAGGGYLHPISGSGVMIDPRGVVLTNAHVGQYFLLHDYTSCVIRTGSPAQAMYTATLLYLPPVWIADNAAQITSQEPVGTGEHDYSFLLITGMTDGSTLPSSFPSLPYSLTAPDLTTPVLLAAYPAGFIEGATVEMNLYAASALSTAQALYSFAGQTEDEISIGGSIVAQAGSSGGAVMDIGDGELTALIATEMTASTTADRDLHAITTEYINRDLGASGLGGITSLLGENLEALATTFAREVAPLETQKLIQAIQKQ